MKGRCLLLADVGNTDAVLVRWERGHAHGDGRLPVGAIAADPNPEALAEKIRAKVGEGPWSGAALCSVVPALTPAFAAALALLSAQSTVVVDHRSRLPLRLLYETPQTLGPDRLVNAVGAWCRLPGGSIVVDAGSALTIDVVSPEAEFLGGVIAPGPDLSARALGRFTARLPRVRIETIPAHLIGRNTEDCLLSGTFFGTAAMIEGLVQRIRRQLNLELPVIATGGWGASLARAGDWADQVDPWLTLVGLARLWELNRNDG